MASIFANYLNSNTNSLAFGNSLFSSGFGSSSSPFFGSSGYSFGNTSSWPAPSKWSNPNVRIGFGFERRHAALPL